MTTSAWVALSGGSYGYGAVVMPGSTPFASCWAWRLQSATHLALVLESQEAGLSRSPPPLRSIPGRGSA